MDPLAIQILNKEMAAQKLDYTHLNSMQPHWLLCHRPADYGYSSAVFYEQDMDQLKIAYTFWRSIPVEAKWPVRIPATEENHSALKKTRTLIRK